MEASASHIKNQVEDSQEVVEHQLISPFLLAYHEEILREKFSFIRLTHYFMKDRTHGCDFPSCSTLQKKLRTLFSMAFACISGKREALFFMESRVRFLIKLRFWPAIVSFSERDRVMWSEERS